MNTTPPKFFTAAFESLAGRCRTLRVPLWHFDATGLIDASAMTGGILGSWTGAPSVREKLMQAARGALATRHPESVPLFPGAHFIPLEERNGAAGVGLAGAVVFTHDAIEATEFTDACAASGVDLAAATADLRSIVRNSPAELEQTEAMLRWSHEDLVRAARDSATLEQFGEKLSQSYEETNLLFRLSRLLGCVSDPAGLVSTFCQQLHEIMPFSWLAVRFDPRHTELNDLADKIITAGESPCGFQAIDREAVALVQGWGADDWTRVLRPGESVLADVAGSEVLAEPITFDGRVIGGLFAGNKRGADPEVSSEETQFIDAAASFLGIFHENAARFTEQRAMFLGVLKAMTASIDAKDPYTCGHSERVGLLAQRLALAAGLGAEEAERYRIAGLVHDVGKIGVAEAVLSKVGRLTEDEFAQIKCHPEIGHQILRDIPLMQDLLPGVLHHHERFDGRGYPHGLSAEQIPLMARILALADTFDAMSSNRSYRPAMPREKVLEEIRKCSGSQFDPELASVFVSLSFEEFDRMLRARQGAASVAA